MGQLTETVVSSSRYAQALIAKILKNSCVFLNRWPACHKILYGLAAKHWRCDFLKINHTKIQRDI